MSCMTREHHHAGGSSEGDFSPDDLIGFSNIKKGDVVQDAGCGSGHMSIRAAERVGSNGTVFAMDEHEPGLEKLRKRVQKKGLENVIVKNQDLTKEWSLDLPADVVYLVNVLHGFVINGEDGDFFTHLKKNLKQDGKVVVVEHEKRDAGHGPRPSERLSAKEVEQVLERYGFTLVKKRPLTPTLHASMYRMVEQG